MAGSACVLGLVVAGVTCRGWVSPPPPDPGDSGFVVTPPLAPPLPPLEPPPEPPPVLPPVVAVESESLLFSLGVDTVGGSGAISPSFIRFFCFIRRFWNQIFTCVSLSCNAEAISMRLARVRYLLKWNSFSSSVSCLVVKLVRPVPPPKPP